MKLLKSLMFSALVGLPLAAVPAMAQNTTSNGAVYAQSGMAPSQPGSYRGAQTNPPIPQHPGAAGGGAEGSGGGGGGAGGGGK